MKIAVAGPYSAPGEAERQENLTKLNMAAAEVLKKGHIPLIGVNAALPVIQWLDTEDRYEKIMQISMAVIEHCDAILIIAESPGANRERDYLEAKGKPVYTSINDIPDIGKLT